jgi:hypothetical protein
MQNKALNNTSAVIKLPENYRKKVTISTNQPLSLAYVFFPLVSKTSTPKLLSSDQCINKEKHFFLGYKVLCIKLDISTMVQIITTAQVKYF